MTTTPPDAPADPAPDPAPEPVPGAGSDTGPRVSRDEVLDLGRLRRSTTDRHVAGVAGGLARHLDVDPIVIRAAFVVLIFFGAGALLYGAAWLLVPDDEGHATVRLDARSRSVALVVVGVLAVLAMVGDSWGFFGFPWPLAILALLVVLYLNRSSRRDATEPAQAAGAAPGAAPASAPPPAFAAPAGRGPRRRGPVLFWFTMALCALGIGVLGLLDMGGVPVADAAYSALVMAVCGVMLVIGAFWGRPGGLVAVGLVAALGTAATTLAGELDSGQVAHRPTTAAGLASSYQHGTGDLLIDLTDVTDPELLDGRTLLLEMGVGRVEVLVPAGLDVTAETSVGIGNARAFGEDHGGFGIDTTTTADGGTAAPGLVIDAHVGIGGVEIHTEGDPR